SIGIIATLMLSHYSDNAVAGVGVANQILNIAILVFNITAIGATILIGQNIGANRLDIARRLARSSIGFNLWVGIGVTIIAIIFFSDASYLQILFVVYFCTIYLHVYIILF